MVFSLALLSCRVVERIMWPEIGTFSRCWEIDWIWANSEEREIRLEKVYFCGWGRERHQPQFVNTTAWGPHLAGKRVKRAREITREFIEVNWEENESPQSLSLMNKSRNHRSEGNSFNPDGWIPFSLRGGLSIGATNSLSLLILTSPCILSCVSLRTLSTPPWVSYCFPPKSPVDR